VQSCVGITSSIDVSLLCYVSDAAAGLEAAQSSCDAMPSDVSSVSASQSLDTRCCALCSLRGDTPSLAVVCLQLFSVIFCKFFVAF